MPHVHHLNLQQAVGGGEIYTRWFTRALVEAGASVTLYVNAANRFWDNLSSAGITVVHVRNSSEIFDRLPRQDAWIVTQSRVSRELVEVGAKSHLLTGFSHMPILNRSASEFVPYSAVFTVSEYCIDLLKRAGISQVYPVPMYGTWALEHRATSASDRPLSARSPYHWDRRKGRDRLLSLFEPVVSALKGQPEFERKAGITLGIVSLLSPIKQFPVLFSILAPHIARFPDVNLEIFGNGGFAQVRDLRRTLEPISDRVRFWGYQEKVDLIYPGIDYLMTGLPEKEALGLNVLEAQALGTPVLAPRAPPFTETVIHGQSGFLYRDPRQDGGRDFGDLLGSLIAGRARPDPREAAEHLANFSFGGMVDRTRALLRFMERTFPGRYGK